MSTCPSHAKLSPALEAWGASTTYERLLSLSCRDPALARIVALRSNLPDDLAVALYRHDDPDVRSAVALRTGLPLIGELATDAADAVRAATAFNPGCPEHIIAQLARDAAPAVRRAVAGQRRLDSQVRASLFADADHLVRRAMLLRDDCTAAEMAALQDDPHPDTRAYIAECGIVPRLGGLEALLNDLDPSVRLAAVESHEGELAPYLGALALDTDVKVRRRVAWPRTTRVPEIIAIQAKDSDAEVRQYAARNIFAGADVLLALAEDPDLSVCLEMAKNPLATPAAMEIVGRRALQVSRRAELVWEVLRHRATPSDVLGALFRRGIEHFNAGNMTQQPNWPAGIVVSEALKYADRLVQAEQRKSFAEIQEAASNGMPDDQVLSLMLNSQIYYLQRFAASSRFTPSDALEKWFASSQSAKLFLDSIASNPATPLGVLEDLCQRGEEIFEMLQNPELPLEVLDLIAEGGGAYALQARTFAQARRSRVSA